MSKKIIKNGKSIYCDKDDRILIPEDIAIEVVYELHTDLCHVGITNLINSYKNFYNIKEFSRIAEEVVRQCELCQVNKPTVYKYGKIEGCIGVKTILQDFCTDIVGPYEATNFISNKKFSKFWILTFLDRGSRFAKIKVILNLKASTVAEIIEKYFIELRTVKSILSDKETQYTSDIYKWVCRKHHVDIRYATAYNATGNSMAERINQTITTVLKCFKDEDIDTVEYKINFRLTNSHHRTMNCSTNELVRGF